MKILCPAPGSLHLFLSLLLLAVPSFPSFAHASANASEVFVLGDSITEGLGVSQSSAFPALLQKEIDEAGIIGVKVINAGVSGSTTASAVSRLKWHLKGKPRNSVLILALGANDGLRGLKLSEVEKNLTDTVELAKKNGMKVLLAGMKLPTNYGAEYRRGFEKVFREVARKERITLIPFLLEGVGGEAELNQPDGLHPNEKGHALIARTVFKYLRPYL